MGTEEEDTTSETTEKGHWNVRHEDTGKIDTGQMEKLGSTEENCETGTMYISELSHCVL